LQAALEIRQLKDTVGAGNNKVKELVQQVCINKQCSTATVSDAM
jgi:hypothetical protein